MSISSQLAGVFQQLIGLQTAQPRTVDLSDPSGLRCAIDFTGVDRLSCSISAIRLSVPTLQNVAVDVLRKWATGLSARVTYLLENLGPLEIDPNTGKVLIRSTPPDQQPDGTKYYEIILESQSQGNFTLKRYRCEKGRAGRDTVEMHLTHEVLLKLLDDLIDSIPAGP